MATRKTSSDIVNADSGTQSAIYTELIHPSGQIGIPQQTTVPQQITILEPTAILESINVMLSHTPVTNTAIRISRRITHPTKTSFQSLLKLSGKRPNEAALQYILDLRAQRPQDTMKARKTKRTRKAKKGPA